MGKASAFTCYIASRYLQMRRDYNAAQENLRSTQARCTELLLEIRSLRRMLAAASVPFGCLPGTFEGKVKATHDGHDGRCA